tara:strand:- start:1231 stop:2247 length:1017 start_codon:yes stop_codon:yes gene_type:complete
MSFVIRDRSSLELFEKFVLHNPNKEICYVYYKENLRHPNVIYVGYTGQEGRAKISYLRNHHKMKNIYDIFQNGISINIYFNYSEDGLIRLLKPIENKQSGTGMPKYRSCCKGNLNMLGETIQDKRLHKNRQCYSSDENYQDTLIIVGELIDSKDKKYSYGLFNEDYLDINFIKLAIENYIKITIKESKIINNNLFNIIQEKNNNYYQDNKLNILTYNKLYSILLICKFNKFKQSFIIIHKIYSNYISKYINYHENICSCGSKRKNNKLLLNHITNENNKSIKNKFIHCELWLKNLNASNTNSSIAKDIYNELSNEQCLNITYHNHYGLWYYYRRLLKT